MKRLTIKKCQDIIEMLATEPDITPIEISKISGVGVCSVYDINRGRTKMAQELWDGNFPIRPLGANKTKAMLEDLRNGVEVEEIVEKWKVSKRYANTLKRRVKKENEA